MNRTELVAALVTDSGVAEPQVGAVLDALENRLTRLAADGGELRWTGLLTLDVVERAARTGRHPRTGEALAIPAARQVRLRPGARLKQSVAGR